MADVVFSVGADLPPAKLNQLTRDFMRDLDRIGIRAAAAEVPAQSGERGVVTTIGKFVISSLFNSKAADALVDLVKAYLAREKTMIFSITKPDGTKIDITSKNVNSGEVAAFLTVAKTVM